MTLERNLQPVPKDKLTEVMISYWDGKADWRDVERWFRVWELTESTLQRLERAKEIDLLTKRLEL